MLVAARSNHYPERRSPNKKKMFLSTGIQLFRVNGHLPEIVNFFQKTRVIMQVLIGARKSTANELKMNVVNQFPTR